MLDKRDELKRLKRDYLELDRVCQEEKELLIRIIHVLGSVPSGDRELSGIVDSMEQLLVPEQALNQDGLLEALDRIKGRLIKIEEEPDRPYAATEVEVLSERLFAICRILRRIMITVMDDFYPLSPQLKNRAGEIDLECVGDPAGFELDVPSGKFLSFLDELKTAITWDFREVSGALFNLLDQVKELEASFTKEFGIEGGRMDEIEYFELKVNSEVGSIVDSFDIHTTVSEIKQAVVRKIENIKELVSLRKQEELSRTESFKRSVQSLKSRIEQVERDALEMSRRAEEFEAAAMKDELTGLYNRKAFDGRINKALEKFNKGGSPFALILFDLDGFKEINDTFGHLAGDKVLQKVGGCLRETFRKHDFIARYGGDEFVVLIEELSRELAREKILAFMKNLKRLRFTSHAKGDISVGVSPGIAMAKAGDSPETLIERADKAMYDVKNKRR